jgi:hypothetical protein
LTSVLANGCEILTSVLANGCEILYHVRFEMFYCMFVCTFTNILIYFIDNWYLREINCLERL